MSEEMPTLRWPGDGAIPTQRTPIPGSEIHRGLEGVRQLIDRLKDTPLTAVYFVAVENNGAKTRHGAFVGDTKDLALALASMLQRLAEAQSNA